MQIFLLTLCKSVSGALGVAFPALRRRTRSEAAYDPHLGNGSETRPIAADAASLGIERMISWSSGCSGGLRLGVRLVYSVFLASGFFGLTPAPPPFSWMNSTPKAGA
jgi:hypothetical protein